MTYSNQNQNDAHGAARSGAQREKALKDKFSSFGFTLVKNKSECKNAGVAYEGNVKFAATGDYQECGFKYFLADGYCPELDIITELKGGDKSGTTEEKIFFDLVKLQDGCYGNKTLVYIFEGKKETDKCSLLFTKKLHQLQQAGVIRHNVYVVNYSQLTKEILTSFA